MNDLMCRHGESEDVCKECEKEEALAEMKFEAQLEKVDRDYDAYQTNDLH